MAIETRARSWLAIVCCGALSGVWAQACAGFDDEESGAPGFFNDGNSSGTGGTTSNAGGTSGNGDGLPNEQELEDTFTTPSVSGTRVFSVNPTSGRVAIIDTETLEVRLTQAGFNPIQVVALPSAGERDRALVLNAGSNDATYFEVDAEWNINTQTIATHVGANRVDVSEDGAWAVLWTDYRQIDATDPTDGFQDVTLVRLSDATATRLTVGFRPVVVAISSESERAFVSAEPGIDVIDLGGERPQVSHSIPFGASVTAAVSHDVRFTRDARYAFIRYQDQPQLAVLDLQDEQWTTVLLGGAVTDLDLSEDGSTAVAVVRSPLVEQVGDAGDPYLPMEAGVTADSGAVADAAPPPATPVLDAAAADAGDAGDASGAVNVGGLDASTSDAAAPPPELDAGDPPVVEPPPPPVQLGSEVAVFRLGQQANFDDPQIIRIDEELFGSVTVSADGNMLALYTTALESDRVTLVNLSEARVRTVSVKSPVLAVMMTADAQHAVSFQAPATIEGQVSAKKGAFSLIPLQVERAPKIVATDAAPMSLGLIGGSDSYAGLITTSDAPTATFATYWLGFPGLTADPIRLASEPLATGVVTQAGLGFVAQRHPEGRLTLVDLNNGAPRTLTGFELAAKVVDR
jgi:hypothetical protein